VSNLPPNDMSSKDISPSDIPQARRQTREVSWAEIEMASTPPSSKKRRRSLRLGLLAIAGLVISIGIWQWDLLSPQLYALRNPFQTARIQSPPTESANAIYSIESSIESTEPRTELKHSNREALAADEPDMLLNHRRYDVAPESELVPLNPGSLLKLQPAAQASLNAMIAKAKAEGVQLGVISAFRDLEDQHYLYFEVKAKRGENAKTRATVSAPPGYSEHHTGYAVDLIDESEPETALQESFENTAAYEWLSTNAAFFNFEMSFPKVDPAEASPINASPTEASQTEVSQAEVPSVAYEPWHWRYVGDQKSLETFYKN